MSNPGKIPVRFLFDIVKVLEAQDQYDQVSKYKVTVQTTLQCT